MRDRMRRLERRQDAFLTGEPLERDERIRIADPRVFGARSVVQPRVLGTDGGVIETGRDRMGQFDIAILVLQHVATSALEDAAAAAGESRGMLAGLNAIPARLDTNQPNGAIIDERIEDAHGVAATADAGDDGVRKAPERVETLTASFLADDRLELAHHERIRMRPEHRSE